MSPLVWLHLKEGLIGASPSRQSRKSAVQRAPVRDWAPLFTWTMKTMPARDLGSSEHSSTLSFPHAPCELEDTWLCYNNGSQDQPSAGKFTRGPHRILMWVSVKVTQGHCTTKLGMPKKVQKKKQKQYIIQYMDIPNLVQFSYWWKSGLVPIVGLLYDLTCTNKFMGLNSLLLHGNVVI